MQQSSTNNIKAPLLSQKHQYKKSRRQLLLSNYDPSAYPPDLDLAKQHGQSQRVGQYISPQENVQRCRCCLQPIHKTDLPLTCQYQQFSHIGICYPLYFYFIKQCSYLLLLNIFLISIPSMIINLTQGNMCKVLDSMLSAFYSNVCNMSVINVMNIQQIDMLQIQGILNFISIILSIFFVAYLDIAMGNQYRKLAQGVKAQDFSLMLKGLPKDITIYQIQKFVQDKLIYLGANDNTVVKIYIIYDLKTIFALYQKKRQLVDQLPQLDSNHRGLLRKARNIVDAQKKAQILTKAQSVVQEINQLEDKIQLIQIEINNYQQSFKILARQLCDQNQLEGGLQGYHLKFSGKCIVTLNNLESRKILIQNRKKNSCWQNLGYKLGQFLGGKRGTLVISQAPQSSDIIFTNMGSQKYIRWRNQILVTLLVISIIIFDFVLLTLSKKLVKQQKSIQASNVILSFVNSMLISGFNSGISRIIRMFQNSSFHTMQSSYYSSVTYKLVILFLINMLVTTFFANLVSFYLIKQSRATFQIFPLNFEEYLFDVFFLLVTNPFISFFLIFFDHRQGYKLYKRYRVQQGQPVTQAQANLHYQNMQIDISNKYGNIYRFILFTAGIGCIYPLSFIICFLTIIVFYWLDKYLLLRRYVPPYKLGYRVINKLQKLMGLFPVLLSITNLIIMFIPIGDGKAFQQGKYSKIFYYLAIFAFLFSLIIYIFGNQLIKKLYQLIFKVKRQNQKLYQINQNLRYKDLQYTFQHDYWHHYPYFRVKKQSQKKSGRSQSQSQDGLSPRKQKIDQLNRKQSLNVFNVIRDYLHHHKYTPNV